MKRMSAREISLGGMIAALYVVLTYAANALGLASGAVQVRFSEALTILPVFTTAAIPGLSVGCLLANLASPFGAIDWITGTFATLSGALLTWALRKIRFKNVPYLAPLPPVITNSILVGWMLAYTMPEGFSFAAFAIAALEVGIGEFIVCYALGLPLAMLIEKNRPLKSILSLN